MLHDMTAERKKFLNQHFQDFTRLWLEVFHGVENRENFSTFHEKNRTFWADWHGQLVHHGLVGLYLQTLQKSPYLQILSDAIRQRLQQAYDQQVFTNMQLACLQNQVLDILQQAGFPLLLLKGQSLSERLYGNALIRSSGDVDIFVRKTDLKGVKECLLEQGFRLLSDQHSFHHTFVHESLAGRLECHWRFADGRAQFDEPGIFDRCHEEFLSGHNIRVMNPNDEFLYCVYQNACNYFQYRLSWLFDLCQFYQKFGPHLDWSRLQSNARLWRIDKAFQISLGLCKSQFGIFQNSIHHSKPSKVIQYLINEHEPFSSRVYQFDLCRKLLTVLLHPRILTRSLPGMIP